MRHHWENPTTQGQGWSTPQHHSDKDCIRRVGEAALCWLRLSLLRASRHIQKGLPWASGFSMGKEDPEETTGTVKTLWVASPEPPLCSCPTGINGVLWASATGGVTMMGKETGVCNNQNMNLGRPCSYLQCPRSTPTSIFAYLQNQVRGKFWSKNSMECRSAWCGSLSMEIWQSESPICPHPGKELNHSPICCRECLSAPFEQKSWWWLLGLV